MSLHRAPEPCAEVLAVFNGNPCGRANPDNVIHLQRIYEDFSGLIDCGTSVVFKDHRVICLEPNGEQTRGPEMHCADCETMVSQVLDLAYKQKAN